MAAAPERHGRARPSARSCGAMPGSGPCGSPGSAACGPSIQDRRKTAASGRVAAEHRRTDPVDTRKLGRIDGIGHRSTGDRTARAAGGGVAGNAYVANDDVAIDDASRLVSIEVLADERNETIRAFTICTFTICAFTLLPSGPSRRRCVMTSGLPVSFPIMAARAGATTSARFWSSAASAISAPAATQPAPMARPSASCRHRSPNEPMSRQINRLPSAPKAMPRWDRAYHTRDQVQPSTGLRHSQGRKTRVETTARPRYATSWSPVADGARWRHHCSPRAQATDPLFGKATRPRFTTQARRREKTPPRRTHRRGLKPCLARTWQGLTCPNVWPCVPHGRTILGRRGKLLLSAHHAKTPANGVRGEFGRPYI
ncbi:hypothetical protein EV667_1855 [Ancylobacter aquaticus]|uniref:Uncharacterized protein n=1 Tax=Ancylobacter aquaticus TaxID=100 RepID=A0A4R1IBM1_ANCAQ|nr:hypothetical protein EV667_1855 [Ancylobacter aquaticus]